MASEPTAGTRHFPLAGADNFRDLGGYVTSDGRTVGWGRVFRSGHLGHLTPADVAAVGRLGIRLVCDLRAPSEREDLASRFPGHPDVKVLPMPVDFPALEPGPRPAPPPRPRFRRRRARRDGARGVSRLRHRLRARLRRRAAGARRARPRSRADPLQRRQGPHAASPRPSCYWRSASHAPRSSRTTC